jgi:hypothetical protein
MRNHYDVSRLKVWRLLRVKDLSFYRFNLKSAGKIQSAGLLFAAFALIWIGLNVHSGWIRYHEFQGDRAFQKIQIPDELALAQLDASQWLTPTDRENVQTGRESFRLRVTIRVVCKRRRAFQVCLV